jgi:hypothetical protein
VHRIDFVNPKLKCHPNAQSRDVTYLRRMQSSPRRSLACLEFWVSRNAARMRQTPGPKSTQILKASSHLSPLLTESFELASYPDVINHALGMRPSICNRHPRARRKTFISVAYSPSKVKEATDPHVGPKSQLKTKNEPPSSSGLIDERLNANRLFPGSESQVHYFVVATSAVQMSSHSEV